MEITSIEPNNPPQYFDNFKMELTNWKVFGLNAPSWVKCYRGNIHRVPNGKLIKRLGSVDSQTLADVLHRIINQ